MKLSAFYFSAIFFVFSQIEIMAGPKVEYATKPGEKFISNSTRILSDLPAVPLDTGLNIYGGRAEPKYNPTGYFRTEKINNRWWIIDPMGGRFIHRGLATVTTLSTPKANAALAAAFKDKMGWATATTKLMADIGFNGTGGVSEDAILNETPNKMVSTRLLSLMSRYGKKRGGVTPKPGHMGYPGDCPFIFDAEFEAFCKEACKVLVHNKNNPWILGYYTDNEMPWAMDLLDKYLKLDANDQGRVFTEAWLKKNKISKEGITDAHREEFLQLAAETYFKITSEAIRANDPNHMVLGARFHGVALRLKPLLRAAGKHCDVISINYYRSWTPNKSVMETWSKESGKPFLITEWYAKGEDSGLANTSGAGWLVRTQKDRGLFYQNFTLALMENPSCVGWHWFRYSDNDPDEKTDGSNIDANKGIVSNRYVPYEPLIDAMREVNLRNYGLIDLFDRRNPPK